MNPLLQDWIGRVNEEHGFHEYKSLTTDVERTRYLESKLLLVVSEIAEAQDELRSGHSPHEIYFDGDKPMGFLTEIADAAIRIMDIFHELDEGALRVMVQKVQYNETRPYKHGRQF